MFGIDIDWKAAAIGLVVLGIGGAFINMWQAKDYFMVVIVGGGIVYFLWTCFEENKKYTLGGMR